MVLSLNVIDYNEIIITTLSFNYEKRGPDFMWAAKLKNIK